MRYHLGVLLQIAALVMLPMIVLWQLNFGFPLIYMPMLLLVGVVVFSIGTKLREWK